MGIIVDANGNVVGTDDSDVMYAPPVPPQAALTEVASTPTSLAPVGIEFNLRAAGTVYLAANTLRQTDGTELTAVEALTQSDQADVDATIKASTVDTNLDAMIAGYKGTELEGQMTSFAETVREYPELKEALGNVMKDEGAAILPAVTQLTTGDGAISMEDFATAMADPAKREVYTNMLNRVATHELGAPYAVEFSRAAIRAGKNPNDADARDEFIRIAAEGGVDIGPVQQQTMMEMFSNIMNDPQKYITQFVDSLQGISQEWKEMLTGALNGLVGFYGDIIGDYLNGHDGSPGLKEIGQNIGQIAQDAGIEDRAKFLPAVAAPAIG